MNRYSLYSKYERPEYLPSDITVQRKRPYTAGNYTPGTTRKNGWWYCYEDGSLRDAEYYQDGRLVEKLRHRLGTLASVVRHNTDGTVTYVEVSSHSGAAMRAKTLKPSSYVLHGKYQEWHPNGRLFLEATFKKGVLHGIVKVFHKNGNLHERCRFIRGRIHGNYLVCYDNGKSRVSYEFKRDKQHGWCYLWHESGIITLKGIVNPSGVQDLEGNYRLLSNFKSIPNGGIAKNFRFFAEVHLSARQMAGMYNQPPRYLKVVDASLNAGASIGDYI